MMSDPVPSDPPVAYPDDRSPLTRRRALVTVGIGIASLVPVSGVLGRMVHDDEADDAADATEDAAEDAADATEDAAEDREDAANDTEVIPEGTVPAGSTEIQIVDDDPDGFQPGTVTIDIGRSVTWVNLDDDAHTATGLGFDTGILQPGDMRTVRFGEAGMFPYSCQIHPMMVGRVEVRGSDGRVADSASPAASPQGSPAASPEASPDASPGATVGGQTATVSIVNIAFDPSRLEVAVGTTVTWTNEEAIPHTVTSADGTLDSDVLERGDTYSHVFDAVGAFDYACAIHPSMTATVVVTN